jgi:hypothetical protein
MKLSTFEVRRFELSSDLPEGHPCDPAATYWDFLINGSKLSELLGCGDDLVSCLSWYNSPVRADSVERLLLELRPEMPNARTALYIEYDCDPPISPYGSYAEFCHVISATIERESDTVVWRDFAYIQAGNARPKRQPVVSELGPFRFAWSLYETELRAALQAGGISRGESRWWKSS